MIKINNNLIIVSIILLILGHCQVSYGGIPEQLDYIINLLGVQGTQLGSLAVEMNTILQNSNLQGMELQLLLQDNLLQNSQLQLLVQNSNVQGLQLQNLIQTLNSFITVSGLASCNPIFSSDINQPGGKVLNITNSRWCLRESINWVPSSDNESAISIMANGVTLDLGEWVLSQGSSATSNNIGIDVKAGVQNININGGKLIGISGMGILIRENVSSVVVDGMAGRRCGNNGSFPDLETPQLFNRKFGGFGLVRGKTGARSSSITFRNINVDETVQILPVVGPTPPPLGENGLSLIFSDFVTVEDSRIVTATSSDAAAPLFIGNMTNVIFRRLILGSATGGRNANAIDSMAGQQVAQSNRGVRVEDLTIGGITSTSPLSNEALGIEMNAYDFLIKNVFVTRIYNLGNGSGPGSNNRASAIQISSTSGGVVEDVTVIDIFNGGVVGGTGFSADSGASYITFRNCKFLIGYNSNNASTSSSEGFRAVLGSNVIFDNCFAGGVNGTVQANAAGFVLRGTTDATIKDCVSKGNSQGIQVRSDGSTPTLRSIIKDNTIQGSSYGGIVDTVGSTTNYYYRNEVGGSAHNVNYQGLPGTVPIRQVPGATTGDPLENVSLLQ